MEVVLEKLFVNEDCEEDEESGVFFIKEKIKIKSF